MLSVIGRLEILFSHVCSTNKKILVGDFNKNLKCSSSSQGLKEMTILLHSFGLETVIKDFTSISPQCSKCIYNIIYCLSYLKGQYIIMNGTPAAASETFNLNVLLIEKEY